MPATIISDVESKCVYHQSKETACRILVVRQRCTDLDPAILVVRMQFVLVVKCRLRSRTGVKCEEVSGARELARGSKVPSAFPARVSIQTAAWNLQISSIQFARSTREKLSIYHSLQEIWWPCSWLIRLQQSKTREVHCASHSRPSDRPTPVCQHAFPPCLA